jgi:hypothetical protein
MSHPLREADLAQPVMAWLRGRGFTPYGEVRWYDRAIDIVGLNLEWVTAVELKTSLTRKVLQQAHINQLAAHFSWVAVGTRPRGLPFGPFNRIGVLSVVGGRVTVLRRAQHSLCVSGHHTRAIRGVCHYKQADGPAGLPGRTGVGPAQDVFDAVGRYRAQHSAASWQELWENVPNHYKHARSMQGAMRVVRDVRAARARRAA